MVSLFLCFRTRWVGGFCNRTSQTVVVNIAIAAVLHYCLLFIMYISYWNHNCYQLNRCYKMEISTSISLSLTCLLPPQRWFRIVTRTSLECYCQSRSCCSYRWTGIASYPGTQALAWPEIREQVKVFKLLYSHNIQWSNEKLTPVILPQTRTENELMKPNPYAQ